MASVDVPVALLGYGTVGSAVNRLLTDSADDIERATGHRLRVVKALVRDAGKERDYPPSGGVLTTDFREIADDPSIAVVAEVMGGVDQTASSVIELLNRGKHVVSANKQLIAQRGPELFAAASAAGVQLRFEASVCAAIPVIKVLRESLIVTNVHRVLGIVNGTTNFVLTEMEAGKSYDEALADAQARGYAEADPTDDVSGADAAAKMAILATVAFNSRVGLADVAYTGITTVDAADVKAARDLDMVIRLVGAARLVDGSFDVRVEPALVDKQHPLAKVDGAFNAVMLQGDAIREITLEGPGRRRYRDRVGRDRRHGQRDRDDGHGLPAERRRVARAAAPAVGRQQLAVLLPSLRRGPPGRARAGRRRARAARRLDRPAPAAAERQRCRAARRHPRGAHGCAGRRARGARLAARGAQALAARCP